MRHLARTLAASALLLLGTMTLCAQEQSGAKQETAAQQSQMTWKIVNTAIFAVLLGWGIAKTAPKFFNARSSDIAKAIKDATGLKIDADFRYSAMDRKMATLSEEVKRMRAAAAQDFEREHTRIREETRQEQERMRRQSEAEIEGLRQESVRSLRLKTARAALIVAERRLRDEGPGQTGFIQDFVRLVEQGAGRDS